MTKAEKILEKFPSVKIGLDDHYGKQTVLNALNQALSMSGVSKSACKHPREFHRGGEEVTFCGLCDEVVY